jgi:hypothetical protein
MSEKLLIFYLTSNDRHFVFRRFIDEIYNSEYRDNIFLLTVNSSNDFNFYNEYLSGKNISYDNACVKCPQSNYLPKVNFAIDYAKKNNYKYILKCDNDMIIPSYTINYIIENLQELNKPGVLTLSPTITTGIPSVEYFIDDFLNEGEAQDIRKEFKQCIFDLQGGIMDYRFLNKCTIMTEKEWNYDLYYRYLNEVMNSLPDLGNGRTKYNYCKFYKGIHPIRYGFGNDKINELIVKYKNKFFEKKNCEIFEDNKPYLCNMCFVIKTENYSNLINNENLIIDGCDEVPLNRYAWNNNLKHLIIKRGYAIHICYNWRWMSNSTDGGSNIKKPTVSLANYEENFINSLYET